MDNWDSIRIKQIKDNTEKIANAFTRIADILESLADRKTEPRYDFGDFADRLWEIAYERGKREALEQTKPQTEPLEQFRVGLEYHTDTTHFGKTKGESVTMDTADTPQTDCPKSCPSIDICAKDDTDCPWK